MFNAFNAVAAREDSPKRPDLIRREEPLYSREGDTRSEFARDYNRILYSTAYRRLRHKTQVFFAPENDHVWSLGCLPLCSNTREHTRNNPLPFSLKIAT